MYNINTNIIKAKIYELGYEYKDISNILGIHEQTISNWINYRNLNNICKFLDLLILLDLDIKDIKKKRTNNPLVLLNI